MAVLSPPEIIENVLEELAYNSDARKYQFQHETNISLFSFDFPKSFENFQILETFFFQ